MANQSEAMSRKKAIHHEITAVPLMPECVKHLKAMLNKMRSSSLSAMTGEFCYGQIDKTPLQ